MPFASLCLLIASVPLPDTPITLTSPAEPAAKLLKEISGQAKLELRCAADAGSEIFLVSVRQMPLNKLMADIAKVSSCKWTQTEKGYKLVVDSKRRELENQETLTRETKKIVDDIAKQREELKALRGKAIKSLADAQDDSDQQEAVIDLISEIDPAKLAAIDMSDRLVFATNNPTDTQLPLPAESRDVIDRFIAHHNERVDYLTANPPPGKHPYIPKRADGVPAKTLVQVERSSFFNELLVFIRCYDKDGRLLLEGDKALDVNQHYYDRPQLTEDNVPISFSTESQSLLHALALSGTPQYAALSPELRKLLVHPEQRDPLDFMARDALLALSQAKKLPIVADIPDAAFGGGRLTPQWKNVQDLENEPPAGKSLDIQESDGCLLVAPADPVRNRERRLDRSSFRALLADAETRRTPSLDARCTFALKNVPPFANPLSLNMLRLLLSSADMAGRAGSGDWSWDMMRLYGLMSPSQRLALTGGGKLAFGDLDANEQAVLKHLLFCGATMRRTGETEVQPERMRAVSSVQDPSDYLWDATEAMPHGLPQDGFLTCNVRTGQGIQIARSGLGNDDEVFGPEDIAFTQLMNEQMAKRHPDFVTNLKGGYLCRLTDLGFMFHISPLVYTSQLLSDAQITGDEPFSSLEDLPVDFKDQVTEAVADLRRSKWANFGGGSGASGTAAPPELIAASKKRS